MTPVTRRKRTRTVKTVKAAVKTVDTARVSALLHESMALHMRARNLRNPARVPGISPVKDGSASKDLLRKAAALRVEAHELDPKHVSSCWNEEQKNTAYCADTHVELMTFYTSQGVL